MTINRPWVKGWVCTVCALLSLALFIQDSGKANAQCRPDSLTLRQPENFSVWQVYNAARRNFIVYMTFEDIPDSCGTYLHPPDTTGWAAGTPDSLLSIPEVRGWYSGDTDRTISFRATSGGTVGGPSDIKLDYAIVREERWYNAIHVGSGYTPGEWLPVTFKTLRGETLDLGIEVRFPPGIVDFQGGFTVGCEDFEGFHIWRGIEPDGSDLEVIAELSKEEAYKGSRTGGNIVDSLYFYTIIPALRETGVFNAPFSMDCLGFRIALEDTLKTNELLWFDCNAFNGFTYYYLVTTFDRGYQVASGRQGLVKIDRCHIGWDEPLPGELEFDACLPALFPLPVFVGSQSDLQRVYAVPNPYRSGGSRLTTDNYHNFPDGFVRFVNVPGDCAIKIYTVSGDLVWESEHAGPVGNIEWDTRNRGGEEVTSGIYIYRIESASGDQVYGRLVVIR